MQPINTSSQNSHNILYDNELSLLSWLIWLLETIFIDKKVI